MQSIVLETYHHYDMIEYYPLAFLSLSLFLNLYVGDLLHLDYFKNSCKKNDSI